MTPRRPRLRVSDHALLRWLERVEGYDLDALRRRLSAAAEAGGRVGADVVTLGAGKLVLVEGVVVTTLRRDQHRADLHGAVECETLLPARFARSRRRRR